VSEAAGYTELVERELRAFIARVESLGSQVDGIGAIGDRSADRVEGAGGRKKFRNGVLRHISI
jgi:hypothetical protein